jgi:hypothetical protein
VDAIPGISAIIREHRRSEAGLLAVLAVRRFCLDLCSARDVLWSNGINPRHPVSHGHTCKTRPLDTDARSSRSRERLAKSLRLLRCSSDRINVHEVMDVADGNVLSRRGSSTPPAIAPRTLRGFTPALPLFFRPFWDLARFASLQVAIRAITRSRSN